MAAASSHSLFAHAAGTTGTPTERWHQSSSSEQPAGHARGHDAAAPDAIVVVASLCAGGRDND